MGPVRPVEPVPDDTESAYIEEVMAARTSPGGRAQSIVYTPLHGVAGSLTRRALTEAGHGDIAIVPEQARPDGRFPRCGSPTRRSRCLDLAVAMATERDADLILANDPDGDRLAVALPAGEGGGSSPATRCGVLMAAHIQRTLPENPGRRPWCSRAWSTFAGTDRRCPQRPLGADTHRVQVDLECCAGAPGPGRGRFVFGFEEALGYSVGQVVRDKDGISAAVVLADISTGSLFRAVAMGPPG